MLPCLRNALAAARVYRIVFTFGYIAKIDLWRWKNIALNDTTLRQRSKRAAQVHTSSYEQPNCPQRRTTRQCAFETMVAFSAALQTAADENGAADAGLLARSETAAAKNNVVSLRMCFPQFCLSEKQQ